MKKLILSALVVLSSACTVIHHDGPMTVHVNVPATLAAN